MAVDVQIGESFVGEGAHAAHINTVLGIATVPPARPGRPPSRRRARGTCRSSRCCVRPCPSSR